MHASGLGLAAGVFSPNAAWGISDPQAGIIAKKSSYPALEYDVVVAGAGPAGIPSAIAAAREGAKVLLIEADHVPGGAPVNMYVTFVCGNPRLGIYREMIKELNAKHDLSGTPAPGFGEYGLDGNNNWWHPTSYVQVIQKMIKAEPNLTLMCGTPVIEAIAEKKGGAITVTGVRVMRNGMVQDIKAKITIDATGTGLVAASAGCEFMYGNESKSDFNESIGMEAGDGKVQPCTLMCIAQRVRKDAVIPLEKLMAAKVGGGMEAGEKKWLHEAAAADVLKRDKGIYLHWGATVPVKNTFDPVEVSTAQVEAYKRLEKLIEIYYEAGYSVSVAPKLGVREVRRIKGDYVLTADDIINGVFPADRIADAHYSLDAWGMQIPENVKHGPPYGIPYRCLTPLKTEGLLTAGRIMSGTKIAHSSYRVQCISSLIGEAAGTAAAMCAAQNKKTREIRVPELQARLDAKGLFEYTKKVKMTGATGFPAGRA